MCVNFCDEKLVIISVNFYWYTVNEVSHMLEYEHLHPVNIEPKQIHAFRYEDAWDEAVSGPSNFTCRQLHGCFVSKYGQ